MDEAARLNVRVHLAHLDRDLLGFYSHERRTAYINLSLTPDEIRETLAHELGHAYHGHTCTEGNEDAADRRAALLLVDPDLYAKAELLHHHPAAIGEALGLSEHIIRIWRDWWIPKISERLHRHA
ncbi:ImmA/IrrE family metallo-endopeptidase [Rathayibacter sp. VKM Ac-2804]|uniref:ImmA/IrrE family metallo-endopeptidase n=1 Tax=Rathayibacter sp. VKM Ac-2804 TaxID=2609257 RepID=UPI00132E85B9|nr:ImmA/IrrE family metallo-endopeptidase [Rathayibacter sp. VKM Ac-2804]QHF24128.1 ImmA/IrrE family metallo-endopeptidase [Rathayibacter sp. VKM Ac-2804]